MARPRKYTARGTVRLSKAERSEAIRLSWVTRRDGKPGKKKAANHEVSETRSTAMKAAWRRRRREGTAPPKKVKAKKLTHAERSVIAQAAAALRKKRAKAAVRLAVKRAKEREQAKAARLAAKLAEERRQSHALRKAAEPSVQPTVETETLQAAA